MVTTAKYRQIGLKLTPQRIAILDYLAGNTAHPSAEDIYKGVSKKFPTMSLATVYTTLAALKEKGNILELTLDADKKRFDPNIAAHSHFICIACKRIFDLPGTCRADLPDTLNTEFTVIESHVEAFGLCRDCKK
jgi:Fur family peroxide stress response transcriptional regulator